MATQDDYALQLQQQAQAQVASQKKKNEGGDNGSKKNPLKLNTPATDTSTKHDINTPPPAPPGTVLDDTNGKVTKMILVLNLNLTTEVEVVKVTKMILVLNLNITTEVEVVKPTQELI